jgi:hypothetical protein
MIVGIEEEYAGQDPSPFDKEISPRSKGKPTLTPVHFDKLLLTTKQVLIRRQAQRRLTWAPLPVAASEDSAARHSLL